MPDAPRLDLGDAERRVRVFLALHGDDNVERVMVEYDRRGAAERAHRLRADQHAERRREDRAALADAHAENTRLRAAVDAVRELCDAEDADRRPWRQWAGHVPVGSLRRALAAAPTPAEDESAPCCRWHSRTCEPPSELCCCQCSER